MLLETYPNSCGNNGDENGDNGGNNGPGNNDDTDAPRPLRMKVPVLSKTLITESFSARAFIPTKVAISERCTFTLRATDSNLNGSKLNLVTASAARFLSRVVLKTIDALQIKVSDFTGKNYGVWINDPNCGQVKIGTLSSNEGVNEAILLPLGFTKYGDYVLSFVSEGSDSQSMSNWLPDFQVLLQVNDDGVDEYLVTP